MEVAEVPPLAVDPDRTDSALLVLPTVRCGDQEAYHGQEVRHLDERTASAIPGENARDPAQHGEMQVARQMLEHVNGVDSRERSVCEGQGGSAGLDELDRKSTRLNSSHS